MAENEPVNCDSTQGIALFCWLPIESFSSGFFGYPRPPFASENTVVVGVKKVGFAILCFKIDSDFVSAIQAFVQSDDHIVFAL